MWMNTLSAVLVFILTHYREKGSPVKSNDGICNVLLWPSISAYEKGRVRGRLYKQGI